MNLEDNVYTDPGLLRKHSEVISITTDKYKYPGVRIFYREHPKASVLPPKLPLLVFIHGRFPGATSVYCCVLRTEVDFIRAWGSIVPIPIFARIFCRFWSNQLAPDHR